ncbi:NAD-dependent dehydratase [Candidatus Gottesmanbacteria bacterium RBG_13_37_7]|uniref:UDP-glucuronate decarboxylase n=1 Tax=Candidatus Gottesmanbacteria bacterium RBG_13_37_7 TaxID=1798369 RepID=A0A1F5YK27_9BACT|nr:MAG: NAD-dependent dehydratase [Candidatus Gottesmanbacteria bacterium RBG_13_37_7]
MKKGIKCLISGGAGFIGSHLCDRLSTSENEIYCIDNLITGNINNIKHLLRKPNFHFIRHDLVKEFSLSVLKKINRVTQIYHLASPASPPKYQKYPIETLLVNSFGTYNLLELARANNAVFLLASTSEVYGNPLIHPQNEKYFGNVNPVGIRSCYDESKRFAESITMEYFRKFRTDVRIIRIFNTYGPRMLPDDGRVISNFINQAIKGKDLVIHGDGLQTRSFCYVSDMVQGIFSVMLSAQARGEVINLGYPEEQTIYQIAQIVLQLTKSRSKIKYSRKLEDDPEKRRPDISKAKQILRWQPTISLEDGLIKTIEFFSSK